MPREGGIPLTLDRVYKIPEVAAWMRCSRASVYKLMKDGQLKSIKIGGSRVITESQMIEFIDTLKQG